MQEPRISGFNVIPIGSEVFTTDGERLGDVEEIRVASFKVDAAPQPATGCR